MPPEAADKPEQTEVANLGVANSETASENPVGKSDPPPAAEEKPKELKKGTKLVLRCA